MTNFQILTKAFRLYESGRKNTAKAFFAELPDSFKETLTKFAEEVIKWNRPIGWKGTFTSPHGEFEVNQAFIDQVQKIVPELRNE